MKPVNWTLSIYDLVGIVVPGFLVPFVISLSWEPAIRFYQLNVWIVLGVSFGLGHGVQVLSRFFRFTIGLLVYARNNWSLLGHLLPHTRYVTPGTFLTHVATPQLRAAVYHRLNAVYEIEFDNETLLRHGKDLAYSPVWYRMDAYRTFVALEDLCLAFGSLTFLIALQAAFSWTCGTTSGILPPDGSAAVAVGASILGIGFMIRSWFFHSIAQKLPYLALLSWQTDYKQQRMQGML